MSGTRVVVCDGCGFKVDKSHNLYPLGWIHLCVTTRGPNDTGLVNRRLLDICNIACAKKALERDG